MEEQTRRAFALRLEALRKERGFQVQQLATLAKVSKPYLSQLEGGTRANPSKSVIAKLAKALEVDPSALTGDAPPAIRSEARAPFVTSASDEVVYRSAYAKYYSAAGAALRLSDHEANPEVLGEEVPPENARMQLGTDPIGVLVEGPSMLGAGVRPGMLAWINTTDRPFYKDGDLVLANVRADEGDDLRTVIKRLRIEAGEYALYSEEERGKLTPFRPAYWALLARTHRIDVGIVLQQSEYGRRVECRLFTIQ